MLLEMLSNAHGATGFEGAVRNIIKEELGSLNIEYVVDRLGNIIVHKEGSGPKIFLDAHMDETAFIITNILEDGTLGFRSLGGISSKVIPAKVVLIGESRLPGVVGVKPIHLQSADERKKSFDYEDCYIDIGTSSREMTQKYVSVGDYAVFDTEFSLFGDGLVKGKALDDRVGCYVLLEILKQDYDCDLYAAFTVMEEVGERGTFAASFKISPDLGIAIEGTVCADMPGVPDHKKGTLLGMGPALSIKDKGNLYDSKLLNYIIKTAVDNKIPYQIRRTAAGANDTKAMASTGRGCKNTSGIAVPCRYIHSSVSVCSLKDIENTVNLIKAFLRNVSQKGV